MKLGEKGRKECSSKMTLVMITFCYLCLTSMKSFAYMLECFLMRLSLNFVSFLSRSTILSMTLFSLAFSNRCFSVFSELKFVCC